MTRWAMVADLDRCVGCQTCTAACKHSNATPPGVQWRKVLDIESGEFPNVLRTFVPVGCMHCADPPCMHVCPSTATGQRSDGIVTIDYDLCIGCAYCAVACPYQARYKVDRPRFAYGSAAMRMDSEAVREDTRRLGVAQKCTFCADRIDSGRARALTPGIDPEATPACVNACIADALHFGDLDDPDSNVSTLLRRHRHFAMHEAVGTGPGFHYLWAKASGNGEQPDDPPDPPRTDAGTVSPGASPWLQRHWDWRAAGNFMCGGAGTGLAAFAAAAALAGTAFMGFGLASLAFIATGLFCVWLEIGRPWRFINVIFNPRTSWMTREALTSGPLFVTGFAAVLFESAVLAVLTALFGLVFLYCQARMVHAAKGIPAWREARVVLLLLVTGVVEGGGLFLAANALDIVDTGIETAAACVVLVLIGLRWWLWFRYLAALKTAAPKGALDAFDGLRLPFVLGGNFMPIVLIAVGLLVDPVAAPGLALGGLAAFAGGWAFKFTLITRAAFNQGFAINRTPARGGGRGGPGIKPGWSMS
ncbi:MAG: 4Fe-4S dicluster domain-containing protein [Rhodospirillales bacterium]|nr:4Fe-4S dicluster domain-containing protein [Rhodospirillales bacterium]